MRARAALLVGAALLAACGDDGAATGPTAATTGSAGTAATVAGGDPSTTAALGAPTTAPGSDGSPPSSAPGGPTTAGDPPPATLDATGPTGSFAPAVLRPDLSRRIVVEVHVDIQPRDATLEHLGSVLAEVTAKDVAVEVVDGPGAGERDWSADAIVQAADDGAGTAQGDGTAVLRLLFLGGTFEGDDGVLGVAVRGDVAAVFVQPVEAAAGLLGDPTPIEQAVATHEVGHLLGLVDLRLQTGRADPEHPGHSANPGSVMYWAVESSVVAQLLGADPPRRFDDADRADLVAIAAGA